jgi:heme/copper-type cytochrome/quinol oxidase subunit 1
MFTVGIRSPQLFFMLSTMLIAVPTGEGVQLTATTWKGSPSFELPMLFALAFLFLFTIGGFSGLMLATAGRLPVSWTPTSWWRTSLRAGAWATGIMAGGLLLAAEVDRQDV